MPKRNAGTIDIDLFIKILLFNPHHPGIGQCLHSKCLLYLNEVYLINGEPCLLEGLVHRRRYSGIGECRVGTGDSTGPEIGHGFNAQFLCFFLGH